MVVRIVIFLFLFSILTKAHHPLEMRATGETYSIFGFLDEFIERCRYASINNNSLNDCYVQNTDETIQSYTFYRMIGMKPSQHDG